MSHGPAAVATGAALAGVGLLINKARPPSLTVALVRARPRPLSAAPADLPSIPAPYPIRSPAMFSSTIFPALWLTEILAQVIGLFYEYEFEHAFND